MSKGFGVSDGTRTRDNRDHNPGLYQLSYAHHRFKLSPAPQPLVSGRGTRAGRLGGARSIYEPAPTSTACARWRARRTRTPDHRLRRPVLYPAELRARRLGVRNGAGSGADVPVAPVPRLSIAAPEVGLTEDAPPVK